MLAGVIGTMVAAGCAGDLPDLPGNAPTLAGAWEPTTSAAVSGCWIIDENGDLVALRGADGETTPFGLAGIQMDGKWRSIDPEQVMGGTPEGVTVEYAAVGEAVLTDSNALIQFTMTIRALGINIAETTLTIEGTYDGIRILGTMSSTFISHVPGAPFPPAPDPVAVEVVRGYCSAPPSSKPK